MELLVTVIGAVLAVFLVIVIHESGHFFVAKAFGVKVLRFSIGFGKPLWSKVSKSGTEYVLAILPLGGYVKMLDDREVQVSQQESQYAYNHQPLLVRMAIVLAGPITNFLLAIVVFWIIFLMGVTYVKPIVGQVVPGSIADRSGIKQGDVIRSVQGKKVEQWQQVLTRLIEEMGRSKLKIITQAPGQTPQEHNVSLHNWRLKDIEPDPLNSVGIIPFQPPIPAIVSKVVTNSPASRSGLQEGELIIEANGQPVQDWPALAEIIRTHPNQEISLTVQKADTVRHLKVQLDNRSNKGQAVGYFGVEVKMPEWPADTLIKPHYSIISAWVPALQQAWYLTIFNGIVLAKMIGGKISLQTLGGPITIFRTAGAASQAGLKVYLGFIAFISVTLGFINILPIPGLDGGHFLFQIIEGIIRRPISERYQMLLLRLGIILIILLIAQGTINDVRRMFS